MDVLRKTAGIARTQYGMVTRAQLIALGVSPGQIQRWVRSGRLEALHPGVYRLAGTPPSWEQEVAAAVLASGPGAVASHRSAARLWGLSDDRAIEVSVPRRSDVHPHGVVVHRSTDLDRAAVSRWRGIAVTKPMRALVDLGSVLGAAEVEDALDRALERRLVTVAGVEASLAALGRRGRSGAGVLRAVLDGRALGRDRPDSLLEPRMANALRAYGLRRPTFQHRVYDGGRLVAKVDFAYPDLRIALEVDGFETHSSPRALQSDLDRQNRLVALGWTVLRFTWADVVRRPEKVAGAVRGVLVSHNGGGLARDGH